MIEWTNTANDCERDSHLVAGTHRSDLLIFLNGDGVFCCGDVDRPVRFQLVD